MSVFLKSGKLLKDKKNMEVQRYIEKKKELYNALIEFLDNETNSNLKNNKLLISNFEDLKQDQDQEEIKSLFYLIIQISHNHKRNDFFNEKIDQILKYFSCIIKQTLSNTEIFNIFKSNKMVLLFLIKNEILSLDTYVINNLLNHKVNRLYFYPEIISHVTKEEEQKYYSKKIDTESFEKKRQIGENDSKISKIIRNDSIVEFITLVNRTNLPLSTATIRPSIFETNPLLNEREPTLIEYASFYGSIQIFNYLKFNNVELEPSLWIYMVHSNNPEMVQLFLSEQIQPPNYNIHSYSECLAEAIKCHHNDVASFIVDNLLSKSDDKFNDVVFESILRFYNYKFFPENIDDDSIFFYLCQFNYSKIVNFIMNSKKREYGQITIQKKIFFIYSIPYN